MSNLKHYKKLTQPTDSAWGRKTWRSRTPSWILMIIEGLHNIYRWIPTIYKDKDWDDYYIMKILQKKIEHQREYLVKANRFVGVDRVNRDMTNVLNLIERYNEGYYEVEYFDYMEFDDKKLFEPAIKENLDDYLNKYKNISAMVKDLKNPRSKEEHAFFVSVYVKRKADKLMWRILSEKSSHWWD